MRVLLFLLIISSSLYALSVDEIKTICKQYGSETANEIVNFFKNEKVKVADNCYIQTKEFEKYKVKIKGNLIYLDSTLFRVAHIKGEYINKSDIADAAKRIETFYKNNGYLKTKVFYEIRNGFCIFNVKEGKLYIITGVKLVNIPVEYKKSMINIFTSEKIENVLKKINLKLREKGYFNVDLRYELEPVKYNYPFFHKEKIFSSIFSVLPFFHRIVNLKVYMVNSKKYTIKIVGVNEKKITHELKNLFVKEVKRINSFYVGLFKVKAKDLLNSLGYEGGYVSVDLLKNEIQISVHFERRYKDVVIDINLSPNDSELKKWVKDEIKKDIFNIDLEALKTGLSKKAFERGFLNIEIKRASIVEKDAVYFVSLKIDLKDKVNVSKVFLNGKELFDFNISNNGLDYEVIRSKIAEKLKEKYYFTYIKLVSEKGANGIANLYYESDISKPVLSHIIYFEDKDIYKPAIKKYFNKDKIITNFKVEKIRSYLKKVGFYEESGVKVIHLNRNKGILLIYNKVKNRNQVYGGLGFTNINGLNVYLGYKRFDLLNHNFNSLVFKSKNELKLHLRLLGYNFIADDMYDEEGIIYDDKSKDNYDVRSKKLYFQLSKSLKDDALNVGLGLDSLKEYNIDLSLSDYKKYDDKIIYNFNIGYLLNRFDILLNPSNGYSISLKHDLFYSNSFFSKLSLSAVNYKTVGDYLLKLGIKVSKYYIGDNEIPLSYRFTLGGPNYMKGYSFEKIGKRDKNNNIYGGNSLSYLELGVSKFLRRNVLVGLFFEAGNANDNFDSSVKYKDIGLQFEIRTPIGPLRLSYANNYLFDNKDKSQAFYISFGQTF
ncbi:hypothetical protein DEFDS_0017 [Deferribacter desulfuricans SSM1]|uniref:Bacterial surface antigen (D15) domain-containing protein n=1 Tax=Deferribacter desulfuricans (strain DSM 14783 / JCM 11476 / NBRC 101012 / SSM1) TaxID=639282 RepID=D3PAA6_DEFDS|nr:BamA/TamA family outer membrane protein [Deferribacter desulfuricans]BAI79529.1 hypothetical protein DEFDS_0017 [Deferribacter desulfuricans SSM1]